jgi:hypothetical protein
MLILGVGIKIARWAFRTYDTFDPADVSLDKPLTLPPGVTCFPGQSIDVTQMRIGKNVFFPAKFPPFYAEWFTRHMRAMKEPALSSITDSEEIYRFLWLRSFHHPIGVRIWRQGEQYFLSAVELSGMGGSNPGTELKRKSRRATADEWDTFKQKLEGACFWDIDDERQQRGKDGADWIMEGLKEHRYHVSDVWSPTTGAYRDACIYLLRISELDIDEKSEEFY